MITGQVSNQLQFVLGHSQTHTVLLPEILTTHCVFSYAAERHPRQKHIYSRVRSFKGTGDPKMRIRVKFPR